MLGVLDGEEALEGETSDEGKLKKIWTQLGSDYEVISHKQLGNVNNQGNNRKHPILVIVPSKNVRDGVLTNTRKLKEYSACYSRIFVKKDVHPSVKAEWKRLKDAEQTERDRPENVGCVIRLNVRERKLYRDNVVIDKWNPFFIFRKTTTNIRVKINDLEH